MASRRWDCKALCAEMRYDSGIRAGRHFGIANDSGKEVCIRHLLGHIWEMRRVALGSSHATAQISKPPRHKCRHCHRPSPECDEVLVVTHLTGTIESTHG